MTIRDALPPGTKVGEYVIDRALSQGRYGLVYEAMHPSLERVALKEYFPKFLAKRDVGGLVPSSSKLQDAFTSGVEQFVKGANLLKQINHPNVIGVFDVLKLYGTAYVAMYLIDGRDIAEESLRDTIKFDRQFVSEFTHQMFDALEGVHAAGLIHGAVEPDNILVERRAMLRFTLIGFGNAKQLIAGDSDDTLLFMPPYSPLESISESIPDSPTVDVYGLGATIYKIITGVTPTSAFSRVLTDNLTPLVQMPDVVATYGKKFAAAVDKSMRIHPTRRHQTLAEFKSACERARNDGLRQTWRNMVAMAFGLKIPSS